ncbi:anthranilate synthase component II [Planctobacterium marinum]|uniref:Glutamine amidotransferase n=1 Tax=Planctobacterium marinum TaxID=1631968 RepID=A0AA48HYI9_9ALTE|nr:glutamine amidotransferase [Planctobacterium marinum]
MRILLLDNFDSFTFNLARYFEELDCEVEVVRNNQITVAEVRRLKPELIVISPGPCSPDEAGISLSLVDELAGSVPIFGVCLGHQVIAQVFGCQVGRASKVMHGKVSEISHTGHQMFCGVPEKFAVTRYHSLVVSETTIPKEFEISAVVHSSNSVAPEVMAIAHKALPLWGVQFHPESHLTEHGHQILQNILNLSQGGS